MEITNSIGEIMASLLASNVIDHELELRSGQTRDFKIGISCIFTKHH